MQIVHRFPAPLLALVLSSGALFSQTNPPASPTADNLITLKVTVDARNGKPVEGLSAADFKLLDNKNAQPIVSFRALTGQQVPTEVTIVLDAVNLPYERVSYARQQIEKFLSVNDGKLSHPTRLAVLEDGGLRMQQDFTTDGNALRGALDSFGVALRSIPRDTGFYGAIERYQISLNAIHLVVAHEVQRPGRKLILWVSPGWPLLSGPQVDLNPAQERALFGNIVMLSTEMRQGQITLDAVNPIGASEDVSQTIYYENFLKGIRDANRVEIGDLGLQVLAVQSGGLVLNGNNDVAGMLENAVAQTEATYELSFAVAPGEHDNDYHQIQVQIAKPGLTAHTSSGYYARPKYSSIEDQKPLNVVPAR
jgi:VWFA-related protein